MSARNYQRQSFEAIRQAERVRFQELQQVQLQYGLDPSWLQSAVENGTDPADARAARDQLLADEQRRAAASAVVPLTAGPVHGPAGAELLLRAWFGRPDAAAALGVVEGQRVEYSGLGRDALARVAGVSGAGADPWTMYCEAIRGRTIHAGGVSLSAVIPVASDLLPATMATAIEQLIRHDWRRRGQFWRAAARVVVSPDMRPRRFRFMSGTAFDSAYSPEAGAPIESHDAGTSGWRYADLHVKSWREEVLVSRVGMIDGGGLELGAWMSGAMVLWNDQLDRQVAELLTGAAVATVQGTFGADHFSEAVSALNRQKVGQAPLGSSRPIALCGENRRALMSAVPGPARASGDESAVLSQVVYSASVDPDFLAVVHPEFLPLAVASLPGRGLDPQAAVGGFAGVKSERVASERGAVCYQDRSDPGLCIASSGSCAGAVRLIA